MRYCFGVIVVFSILFGANAAQDEAAKKDLDGLQGVWQFVSMEIERKSLPPDQLKTLKLTFKGNKASHNRPDGKTEDATFKLDPSKKPKATDFMPFADPGKGNRLQAIYSIEGDTLKICGGKDGNIRPKEFKAGEGVVLMVLTREKK